MPGRAQPCPSPGGTPASPRAGGPRLLCSGWGLTFTAAARPGRGCGAVLGAPGAGFWVGWPLQGVLQALLPAMAPLPPHCTKGWEPAELQHPLPSLGLPTQL